MNFLANPIPIREGQILFFFLSKWQTSPTRKFNLILHLSGSPGGQRATHDAENWVVEALMSWKLSYGPLSSTRPRGVHDSLASRTYGEDTSRGSVLTMTVSRVMKNLEKIILITGITQVHNVS